MSPPRVFVYEYTCAVALAGRQVPASLHAEGRAMLAAVLADFRRAPGLEAWTLSEPFGDEEAAFRAAARRADYSLVIAPEFDDLLATRCGWAGAEGSRLLGPSVAAVRLTGDKLALARHLAANGVPTPETWAVSPDRPLVVPRYPAVCKPRCGAGSQATFLVSGPDDFLPGAARVWAEGWSGEAIVQPFVPGRPASVAFLVGPRQRLALLPASQELSADGRFRYQGGQLPLPPGLAERAVQLADRAAATVSGLLGYVGVDLILGKAGDGGDDQVIEINPRLTTSYVGLRALAQANLAEAMLRVVLGEDAGKVGWRPGGVRFRPDGSCSFTAEDAESAAVRKS